MPQHFLRRKKPLPLHKRALNLPIIHRRINTPPNIHFDIRAAYREVAGQRVDFDLGGGDALREVKEHLARVGAPDVACE